MAEKSLPPRRMNNKHEREHEWITYGEFVTIRDAAATVGRHRHRDSLMIAMAFRHGLRATELVHLLWHHVHLDRRTLEVHRVKKGTTGTHDLNDKEVKALKKLAKEGEREGTVFKTERGGPLTTSAFFKIVARAGREAGYSKPLHPHMFRHGCGFHMTEKRVHLRIIQEWLGHRNIQTTVIYAQLAPGRLKGAFPDDD
jgi:site-specific recombinase XerD